ncbi:MULTISPECIES: fe2+ zn2+ uptake regulation protein [Pseudomonas]|uniref:fe2+ zn2+ uptake regulation protein n=1 Tax=Pseudomonas TaxID=286 RepID=UPI001AE9CE2D|nr:MULTISPECIES: fe2+ zn2+ uptake regulation protein [unclassified Pseudomonas]WQG57925.1 fe2+ zn2+ uptake regulation protein [Pseudomonas sp. RTB3]MBP1124393.1 Fe2+ or Zn2+ uptake regulation protein [Pseudomonas sp. PvP025]MDQ0398253.1 Fe2+ or Zn2+ uptake regulation protein [Pseudomonas sp. PvP006]MEB0107911.1 fe2+ zn2+ uptake regulation protein [Pseudomonas sp. MH9.3]WPX80069.1 fe2+ zn2+ uptake regulation protein [Pseudomonas sp. MH9.3]
MYNPPVTTDGHSSATDAKFGSGTQAFGKTPEQQGNQRIRHLLKCFGLRTSLIRLKVIDALLTAADNQRTLGVRGVHGHLLELGIPLSFLSVREVLKRLCSEGVITLNADKSYSLHEEAAKVLEGRA